MGHSINFYVTTSSVDDLQERYGRYLEEMGLQSLLTFRCVVDLLVFRCRTQSIDDDNYRNAVEECMESIDPRWKDEDTEAWVHCKLFLTEEVDGHFAAIHYLDSMIKALTDSIECHSGYTYIPGFC